MYTLNLTVDTDAMPKVPVFLKVSSVAVLKVPNDTHNTTQVVTNIGEYSVLETVDEIKKMISDQEKQNG